MSETSVRVVGFRKRSYVIINNNIFIDISKELIDTTGKVRRGKGAYINISFPSGVNSATVVGFLCFHVRVSNHLQVFTATRYLDLRGKNR